MAQRVHHGRHGAHLAGQPQPHAPVLLELCPVRERYPRVLRLPDQQSQQTEYCRQGRPRSRRPRYFRCGQFPPLSFQKKKIFCFDSHAIYLAVSLCRIEWLIAKLPVFPLPRSILPMTMASSKETGRAITEAVKRPLNGRAACSSSRVTGTPNDPSSTGSAGCFPASLPQVPPPFRVIYRRRFLANTSKRFPLPKRAKIFRKWDLKFEWKMGRCWEKKKRKIDNA